MIYEAENKIAYLAHKNERPKIFKPKLCHDCDEVKLSPSKESVKTHIKENTIVKPMKLGPVDSRRKKINPDFNDKFTLFKIRETDPENLKIKHQSNGREMYKEVKVSTENNEEQVHDNITSWPAWSSKAPESLGEFVRSVFLDLCDGLSVSELQLTYPHQWGVLLSRVSHRPDLRIKLQDRVTRGL